MDKYINVAEIAFAFKEEEVAAQYGGKNDITTGILFALDTLELDMPESIVRCKDCVYYEEAKVNEVRNVDGYCYDDKPNFCPNCGADMRKGENDG